MKKIVIIQGSPRKKGNSSSIADKIAESAQVPGKTPVSRIYLNGLNFKGCQGCEICNARGKCILDDELTPIIAELQQADVWILASPIYYDGISGQLKTFFDRCRTFTWSTDGSRQRAAQLSGKRQGVIVLTYADSIRDKYLAEAQKLAHYLNWMGDFGEVSIICENSLHSSTAVLERNDIMDNAADLGRKIAQCVNLQESPAENNASL